MILMLLAEHSMHGYQIISTIGERTKEQWTPSPGAMYPRLSMLEDEGLITIASHYRWTKGSHPHRLR